MRTILCSFMAIALSFITARSKNTPSDSQRLSLYENWFIQSSAELQKSGKIISSLNYQPEKWYPTTVPMTVLAALVENGVYPDPYYGANLKRIPGFREGRWLAMPQDSPFYPSWWYRTEFIGPINFNGKNISLHLDGINYKANIWLNEKLIADSSLVKGMFRRFEFDVTGQIRIGDKNVLAIEVFAPGKLPDIRYRTKQLEATTGWDDHNPQPPDLNMGLWRNVYFTSSGPIILRHSYVVTDLNLPCLNEVHLTISTELTNISDQEVVGNFRGSIEHIQFSKQVRLQPGEIREVKITPKEFGQLTVHNPRLWWPHPVGPQEMYELDLNVVVNGRISDSTRVKFGVREVSTYINEEGWRGYKVNGKRILIRGGAWMTSDMLLRLTKKRYEALVRYARDANLNMLRSEGFSIRETDEFYELCDRYGIMVTQQIFGRSIPDENLAISNVKDMILRIRNHPSLIHFLGHDETFPTPTLDKAYRELIEKYTPERTYQPHSGAFEIENRFKTGGTRTGTLELWAFALPAHYYTHKADGAWGFAQSGGIGGIIAPITSMRKMMPTQDLWPIYNQTFSFHTVLQGVAYFNALIEAIDKRYGQARSIEDFCMKGQAMNYESARGMFEAYGRNKYDALGITTWKYNAAWPAAITWQYVDWYLNVGGAYYGAKKACEPLHVQYSYDDHSVFVINNYYQRFDNLKVTAKIYNFDISERFSNSVIIDVPENGKLEAFKIDWPEELSRSHFLSLKLTNDKGDPVSTNFYWLSTVPDLEGTKGARRAGPQGWHHFFSKPKSFADHTDLARLSQVELETSYSIRDEDNETVVSVSVKNPTPYLAFMVQLAVNKGKSGEPVLPCYWDDNYFSLLPGEEKQINGRFSKEYLVGARPILSVSGWNIK